MKCRENDFIDEKSLDNTYRDLQFFAAQKVEALHNKVHRKSAESEYTGMGQYAHLRENPIDLEAIALTDRQLMAVAMVFYGGIKKMRAAQAMKVTKQAFDELIERALKKIEESLIK